MKKLYAIIMLCIINTVHSMDEANPEKPAVLAMQDADETKEPTVVQKLKKVQGLDNLPETDVSADATPEKRNLLRWLMRGTDKMRLKNPNKMIDRPAMPQLNGCGELCLGTCILMCCMITCDCCCGTCCGGASFEFNCC